MHRAKPYRTKPEKTLHRAADLVEAGLAAPGDLPGLERVVARYTLALTPDLAGLIDPGDPDDPIARQFVPDTRELTVAPEERPDPIGDAAHSPIKGIVHRYPDRVLLTPVHVCPVYCRYCFRREKVGPGGGALNAAEVKAALDYIRAHRDIFEVILTGGDPLVLAPAKLGALVAALADIPHVQAIRIHTRVPIARPRAISRELLRALRVEKALFMVVHCNHPREVTPLVKAAALRLTRAGIPLLSQTVLLRGVNDSVATLETLFRTLLAARIKPYYLHHGDLAPGTAHFRTAISDGQALVRGLRGRLSGLAQPAYVLDIPGGYGKVPIGPNYIEREGEGWRVEDPQGGRHTYPPGGKEGGKAGD
ncbi:MAG: lysine-2,3-aminomutase-like protein [Rhodospirillaceae bacterium]|nr:lysine-2,3-aminomutase-like protein [Rhodospirillaceae bacterium]